MLHHPRAMSKEQAIRLRLRCATPFAFSTYWGSPGYGNPRHLLLDEIQNLPKWELFVNRLQRQGYRLLLTGSNAHLLSGELATHLTGRHLPIVLFPFSFTESVSAFPAERTAPEWTAALRGRIRRLPVWRWLSEPPGGV